MSTVDNKLVRIEMGFEQGGLVIKPAEGETIRYSPEDNQVIYNHLDQLYSWTVGTGGTLQPWGVAVGATTEFHDAVSNALGQTLEYATRARQEREQVLRQIVEGLFQIATQGLMKDSLWASYQSLDNQE